ncbi:peptide ligase PGM1-related protein [soil metagenome]
MDAQAANDMCSSSHAGRLMPRPGSAEELRRFAQVQSRLAPLYEKVLQNSQANQTVLVVPSLSLDVEELAKIKGVHHYEERLLCMFMMLRMPGMNLVYVTSQPISPTIIDYYLHLLPGVPISHARSRLTLLSCHDASRAPLTEKILARPRLMERIRAAIPDRSEAHMTCFNTTRLERTLSVQLDMPIFANDPALNNLGTKSGNKQVFREAGIPAPDGAENLQDAEDIAQALAALKDRNPELQKAAIKLNEGFSGEGNATFSYKDAPDSGSLVDWIGNELPERVKFESKDEIWEHYLQKFEEMGGIVESFVEGEEVRSPSVQCRIDPMGGAGIVSTHDQMLGGPSGQIFLGAAFPADDAYRQEIHEAGDKVCKILQKKGVLGRFAVDFVSVKRGDIWEHAAIEINIRKGGTTHPYLMLQFLTDGDYDIETGLYYTPAGRPCYYYASDNIQSPAYVGLTPDDLMDIAVDNDLHFDAAAQQGVVFHLIGALSEFGKLGAVCISDSRESAQKLYQDTLDVLDREARQNSS